MQDIAFYAAPDWNRQLFSCDQSIRCLGVAIVDYGFPDISD